MAYNYGYPQNPYMGYPMPQGQQYAKAVELIKGKDAHQLQTMAQNMARERGIDINELMRSLGISR